MIAAMNARDDNSRIKAAARAPPASTAHRVRIIGGRWRGTRLDFPKIAAIRPTPDRVRETLFNWLQHEVQDARCLDLFAGSGALGIEALSRGAQSAVFVEQQAPIARYLTNTLARLKCATAQVQCTDALSFLQRTQPAFDLVFVDPPFDKAASADWLAALLQTLDAQALRDQAWIYLECPASLGAPDSWAYWPKTWRLHRSKQAGQVGYHLARRLTSINQHTV